MWAEEAYKGNAKKWVILIKKLKKINDSCAVVALHYISGLDEEAVLRICRLHGFEVGHGMSDEDWQRAAVHLGIKFRGVALEKCHLNKFMKNHKSGLYLLGTCDHIFVLDNGIIIDPRNKKPPGLKRIIKQAWRVSKPSGTV